MLVNSREKKNRVGVCKMIERTTDTVKMGMRLYEKN